MQKETLRKVIMVGAFVVLAMIALVFFLITAPSDDIISQEQQPSSDSSVSTDAGISSDSGGDTISEPSLTDSSSSSVTASSDNSSAAESSSQSASVSSSVSDAVPELRFRNRSLLDQHYNKHGIEMGFRSAEEYEKAAAAVPHHPDVLHKLEKEDGDDVYYIEATNEFVVVSKDGYIRTYFLPDAGKRYFDRQ